MIKVILIFLGLVQGAWALNTYEQKQATWVFSGMVVNEHGEHYGYLFEMQRVQQALQVTAALFDAQTHQVLLREEAHETIASQDESSFNWHVGNAFLHFNPINETWIFGVKTKEKKGFNFKVDTLTAPEQLAKPIYLRSDMQMKVVQTKTLNGHIQMGPEQEQFVTANSAWLRHIWFSKIPEKIPPLEDVLCQFEDGSGFYSTHLLQDAEAMCGATAGIMNAQGEAQEMSQFISIQPLSQSGTWAIHATLPKLNLLVENLFNSDKALRIAGFVSEKEQLGFCMLNLG